MTSQLVRLQVASFVFAWLSLLMGAAFSHAEEVPPNIEELEHRVHELVNAHRISRGLEPLDYNEKVALVARGHSRDMARGLVGMGHEGAEKRGDTLAQIITYTQFAENVGVNKASVWSTARTVVRGWLNSPSHRRNMERDADLTGVGVARNGETFFFTQLFLTTRSSPSSMRARRRPQDFAPARNSSAHDKDESHLRDDNGDTSSQRRGEADPRERAGRKRVGDGWVQELDKKR